MLSAARRSELIGLASAFGADARAERGGRAANNKRRSLHIKLLSLWQESLQNFSVEVFGLPPGQVPALANKFFCISARLAQVSTPGYVVYKGTPLLPRADAGEDSEDSDSDSVLGTPLDIIDLTEDPDPEEPASSSAFVTSTAAASFVAPSEPRSRSPTHRPRLPVAPSAASCSSAHSVPRQKARPKPRVTQPAAPPSIARVTQPAAPPPIARVTAPGKGSPKGDKPKEW